METEASIRFLSFNLVIKVALLMVYTITLFSCEPNEIASNLNYLNNDLYVTNKIGAASSIPTVNGTGPFTFSLYQIGLPDGSPPNVSDIDINPNNGVVSIKDNNSLGIGTYILDIAVANSAGTAIFEEAFEITVIGQTSVLLGKWDLIGAFLVDGDVSTPNKIPDYSETRAYVEKVIRIYLSSSMKG